MTEPGFYVVRGQVRSGYDAPDARKRKAYRVLSVPLIMMGVSIDVG